MSASRQLKAKVSLKKSFDAFIAVQEALMNSADVADTDDKGNGKA